MIEKRVVHLLSGGIDSTVLLYDLVGNKCKVHALLIDYGQAHRWKELGFAVTHCKRMKVPYTKVTIPQLRGSTLTDGKGTIVVPNRNAIFLSIAANLAVSMGIGVVTFAANSGDEVGFPDCRRGFLKAFNEMLRIASVNVDVRAPYIDKSKAWICALGQDIGVRFEDTWSCYEGGPQPCGKCDACLKREAALR